MQTNPTPSKPFVVPVFLPHAGCPHRCVFCNQQATTGQEERLPAVSVIRRTIRDFLAHRKERARRTEISFYGGNFLGLAPELITLLLATAAGFVQNGEADGIRFSTRPDTIDATRLALLTRFPVTTVELGVQSMNDAVLRQSQRGHTAQTVREAVALLRTRPYALGLQMMVGLPGDTAATALATARQIADLAPDFVRIYPTLVLRGSPLSRLHARGEYEPLTLEAAVALVADLYTIFHRNDIVVARMGLQAGPELSPDADLVAGPFHPAFGEMVQSALWLDAISRHLEKEGLQKGEVILEAPARLLSQIKGQKDFNLLDLLQKHQLQSLEVRANPDLAEETLRINGQMCARW
jgi:histone acetyltransferase (RNA polymerase elongator complex component)